MAIGEHSTVLVTGGAGFIGSAFVHHIASAHPGWTIRVLDALTYCGFREHLEGLDTRVQFTEGDIACPNTAAAAVAGCDAVVNFAAESHVDRSIIDSAPFTHTNVDGVQVLLDACRAHAVGRFVQVSTDEVYGDVAGTDRLSLESDAMAPVSPYARSKTEGEAIALAADDLDVVVTRGSNTYGPRQYPEKVIPLFVTNAIDGGLLPVYGDGTAMRDYMHVDDHAAGIHLVLHEGERGAVYNLGAREQINGNDVAAAIVERVGGGEVRFVPDRPEHDMRYAVDPTAAEALGWTRRWSFIDGLNDTVQWYRANSHWWRAVKASPSFRHFDWG
ncbi:MAG: GDP-mannose 4,6-dehydratase [Phycisphaerales bacterium]|nr:GDP-mannose 4,6-dehydratase [Phycisphaerales bacterium]